MEDFQARQFVNGSTIRSFVNRPVSVFVKIESIDSSGTSLKGQTTDLRNINLIVADPVNSALKEQWIEANGVAVSADSVKCEKVVTFDPPGPDDEVFDTDSHNLLVHFMNNDADTLYQMN